MCMSFYLFLCMWLYAYVYPCMCTYLGVLTAAITISNGFGEQRRPGRRCGHGPRARQRGATWLMIMIIRRHVPFGEGFA